MDTISSDKLDTIRSQEEEFQVEVYPKLPVSIERGEGCFVFDQDGNRYLDMYSGHCVTSTGHCHPRVVAAIQRQSSELLFYSNATYSSVRGRALEKLIELSAPYTRAFLVNSGAEANENAIKLARAVTGRQEVISMEGAFHGRTYGSLSASGIAKYRDYLNTPVPRHTILPPEEVAGRISSETAAVIVEPIQSMGGVVVISLSLLQSVAEACRQHGALLIFDEIQTGIGRTGSFLYSQKLGLVPDVTTLAKGIASGFPAGAVLVTEEVAEQIRPGDLGSTFGGNALASAAMEATCDVIREESLLKQVEAVSGEIRRRCSEDSRVAEVRGAGLLIGLSVHGRPAREVQTHLFQKRVLSGSSSDPAILRLMPALILGDAEVEAFFQALEEL